MEVNLELSETIVSKCVETIEPEPKSLMIWLKYSPDYNAE